MVEVCPAASACGGGAEARSQFCAVWDETSRWAPVLSSCTGKRTHEELTAAPWAGTHP